MRNVKKEIAELLAAQVESLTAEDIEKLIEIPADPKMGDYAFPCFRLAKVMRKDEFTVTVDLHLGRGEASIYTCDLSLDYVHINADYTT